MKRKNSINMFYTHYTKDGKVFNSDRKKSNIILHREDGPALILNYDYGDKIIVRREEYRLNGKLHDKNKPSIISYHDNGNIYKIQYLYNNRHHRENGPALTIYDNNGKIEEEMYFYNNRIHRTYGPSIIRHRYGKIFYFWFCKGEEYSLEVKNWRIDNKFDSWKQMTESDFDRMWMEIL